jgi:hypothetical protein
VLLTHGGDALISWSWEWYERFSVHPPRVLFQDTEPYVFGRLLSHQPTQKKTNDTDGEQNSLKCGWIFFLYMEVYAAGKIIYTIKGYKREMFHGPV